MDPVLRHCRDAKRAAAIHEVEVFIPVATLVSDRDPGLSISRVASDSNLSEAGWRVLPERLAAPEPSLLHWTPLERSRNVE